MGLPFLPSFQSVFSIDKLEVIAGRLWRQIIFKFVLLGISTVQTLSILQGDFGQNLLAIHDQLPQDLLIHEHLWEEHASLTFIRPLCVPKSAKFY